MIAQVHFMPILIRCVVDKGGPMTHEATLTTLARYKALQYAKAAHRHAGGKPQWITAAQMQANAEAYLDHPEVVAWAQQAVTNIKTSRPKTKR